MVIYALLLIVLMILRPQGLFGTRELWDAAGLRRLLGVGGRRPVVSARPGGQEVTMRFGGLKALSVLRPGARPGGAGRAHRPERRRQDHRLQCPHRRLHADGRGIFVAGRRADGLRPHQIAAWASPAPSRTSGCSRSSRRSTTSGWPATPGRRAGSPTRSFSPVRTETRSGAIFERAAGPPRGDGARRPARRAWPRACPTASSAGWRSLAPWPPGPRSSASTSPRPA